MGVEVDLLDAMSRSLNKDRVEGNAYRIVLHAQTINDKKSVYRATNYLSRKLLLWISIAPN